MIETILSSDATQIVLKAQKALSSTKIGEQSTKTKGRGYDFVELREYASGEDIKYIDWTISSKLGKPHVKVFAEQKELNVAIVPLLNASLHFGVKVFKQEVVAYITALLALSCIKQNNPFSSYICNETTKLHAPRSKSLQHVQQLVATLSTYETRGHTIDYQHLESKLFTELKQKSMLLLIGDFFDTKDFNISVLASKHELICIIVRDRFEEAPEALGEIEIIDPQSGATAFVNLTKKSALKIKEEIAEEDALFLEKLKHSGVRFVKIYTDENPAEKIISLMSSVA